MKGFGEWHWRGKVQGGDVGEERRGEERRSGSESE